MAQTITEHLLRTEAVRFGEFQLTSGATSDYYVDVKRALCDAAALRDIARHAAELARGSEPDAVAGMALGAVPFATAVSLETGLPLLMIRKNAREHGTAKRIEGPDPAGMSVLVVEDVTTSGGSTIDAVRCLRDAGATVTHAVVVVDRQSGAKEALRAEGVTLLSLVDAEALLATPEAQEARA